MSADAEGRGNDGAGKPVSADAAGRGKDGAGKPVSADAAGRGIDGAGKPVSADATGRGTDGADKPVSTDAARRGADRTGSAVSADAEVRGTDGAGKPVSADAAGRGADGAGSAESADADADAAGRGADGAGSAVSADAAGPGADVAAGVETAGRTGDSAAAETGARPSRANRPDLLQHSAIGAPYAHVTAPLRRLGDRFATEICLARTAGTEVPQWVRDGLSAVAATLRRTDAIAGRIERACIDLTESTLLSDRVGTTFEAVVLREANGNRPAEIFVADPPVLGPCTGEPPEGSTVRVQLTSADPTTRKVTFAYPA
ncbi:hypothetical protein [Nocardia sp. NPDC051832]|uniref:hypothetical protein n=1 Tax=Nocardia sp. NPDC051832 TaxID=3155673 RepID=UPI00341C9D39